MKALFLLASAMLLGGIIANAQTTRFGFTAGTAISNYTSKVDGDKETEDARIGLTAGILVDLPAGKNFTVQPGLSFIQKGTKDEQTYGNVTEKVKLNMNCIELALNFLYHSTGNSGSFFIGAGPSFGFNTSGKLSYSDGTDSYSEKIEIGNDPDNDLIKGLDIGANVLAGYRLPNGLFFSAGYNAGLNNLFPGGSDDGTLKSHYFGIKLGLMLKGNSKK